MNYFSRISAKLAFGTLLTIGPTACDSENESSRLNESQTADDIRVGSQVIGTIPFVTGIDDSGNPTVDVNFDVPLSGNGFSPRLGLSYQGGGRGSLSGLVPGWGLRGLVSIERCQKNLIDDGTYGSIHFSSDDRFCFQGKRLQVVVGSYGEDSSEYRTVPDEFAKVVFHRPPSNPAGSFEVFFQSGEHAWLGTDDQSREMDGLSRGAFSWHVRTIEDRAANQVEWTYQKSESSGRPEPARIKYGQNRATSVPSNRSVVFEWDQVARPVRYRFGSKTESDSRLKRLAFYKADNLIFDYRPAYQPRPLSAYHDLVSITKCYPSSGCLASTNFQFEGGQSVSFAEQPLRNREVSFSASPDFDLAKTWRFKEDLNNDGFKDFLSVSKKGEAFLAKGGPNGLTTASKVPFDTTFFLAFNKTSRGDPMFVADVDGDGLSDLIFLAFGVATRDQGIYFAKGNGSGFENFIKLGDASIPWDLAKHLPTITDINSDGRPDVILFHEDGVVWYRNDGSRFAYAGQAVAGFSIKTGWVYQWHPRTMADVSGDGYPDIVGFFENGARLAQGSGQGFSPAIDSIQDFSKKQGYSLTGTPRFLVDANGDGLADIVAFASAGIVVALSDGNGGFAAPNLWIQDLGIAQGWDANFKGQRLFSDLNNDGLLDFVGLSTTGITAYLNIGRPLAEGERERYKISLPLSGLASWLPSAYVAEAADIDGDGVDDLSIMLKDGLFSLKTIFSNRVLKSVSDAYGNSTTFEYKPENDPSVYRQSKAGAPFPRSLVSGTRLLVSAMNQSTPGQIPRTIRQKYEDGIIHLQGHGFLGFTKITTEDSAEKTRIEKVKSDGSDGNPEGGMLSTVTTLISKDREIVIGRTQNQWKRVQGSGPGAFYWHPDSINSTSYSPEDGSLISTTSQADDYDAFGNLKKRIVNTSDVYGKSLVSTVNEYDDRINSWQLSRISKGTVTSREEPADPTKVASERIKKSSFSYDSNGLLYSSTVEPDSSFAVTEYYGRSKNKFGHIDTITKKWTNALPPDWAKGAEKSLSTDQTTVVERQFDNEGFLRLEKNALGHEKTTIMNQTFGVVEKTVDANQVQEEMYLTEQGLVDRTIDRHGVPTTTSRALCKDQPENKMCPAQAQYLVIAKRDGLGTVVTYFDGKSLEVRRETQGFTGKISVVDRKYDNLQRLVAESEPYFKGESPAWNSYAFDEMGRLRFVEKADGSKVERRYNGLTLTEIDPDNKTTTKFLDSRGRIHKVVNQKNEAIENIFDAEGHVVEVVLPTGAKIGTGFDILGRRIRESDPNRGATETFYNAEDLPAATKDALGQVTIYQYDQIKRLTSRSRVGGTTDSFEYDKGLNGVGLVYRDAGAVADHTYSYTKEGRLATTSVRLVAGGSTRQYSVTNEYDTKGRLEIERWSNGVAVKREYDDFGAHTKTVNLANNKPLWSVEELNARGTIKSETLGNGIRTSIERNPLNGRIVGVSGTLGDGRFVLAETYDYYASGDLRLRKDNQAGYNESFEYDDVHRLKTVRDGSGMILDLIEYDTLGNITKKQSAGAFSYERTSCGVAVPIHAPSAYTGKSFCYDAKGQLLNDGTRTLSYNFEGQATSISNVGNSRTAFKYDALGKVVAEERTRKDGKQELVMNPFESLEVTESAGVIRERVKVDGRVFIEKSLSALSVKWVHTDRIGSLIGITDEQGNLIEKLAYDPFGRRIDPAKRQPLEGVPISGVSEGFTGHRHVDEAGLIHMRGRIYDPVRGQFTSADPITSEPLNLQAYNRYLYVYGNPLTVVDPSGYFGMKDVFRGVGDLIDGTSGAFKRLGKWLSKDQNQRLVVGMAVMAVAAWYALPYGLQSWQLYAYNALGGATSAAVMTKGNVDAMTRGALTAVAFAMVSAPWTSVPANYAKVLQPLAKAAVAGASMAASGGKFEQGFAVSLVSTGLANSGFYENVGIAANPTGAWEFTYNTMMAAVVGGGLTEMAGGKFENGAITFAFQRLYGDTMIKVFQPVERAMWATEWAAAAKLEALLQELSGDYSTQLDLSKVTLTNHPFYPGHPDNVAMTPSSNRIYFPGLGFDMSTNDNNLELLIHELVHVWQHQNDVSVLMRALPLQVIYWGSLRSIDVYSYGANPIFHELSVEQQGSYVASEYIKRYGLSGTQRKGP